jgi:Fic family protein
MQLFRAGEFAIPATTGWYLSELGEFRGMQELFTRQSPQRLKVLREHAMIESAVASNRIEGVMVAQERIPTLFATPRPLFHDRDEEEVRGYRDALAWIHQDGANLAINDDTIKRLHAMTRGQIWDAGQYKDKDGDIIERYPDGRELVRFHTVPAQQTPDAMARLITDWRDCMAERRVPHLIALAAFNLDFLCIHPFRDGNGRVSHLLWLLQSYQLGLEVGRYISLERLVEHAKDRYYETVEQSSDGWHENRHNPWPYINYVLSILKTAYREFADQLGDIKPARGAKRDLVLAGIERLAKRSAGNGFSISELEQVCPGVSRDMVRTVLRTQQKLGKVACAGRGSGARWKIPLNLPT